MRLECASGLGYRAHNKWDWYRMDFRIVWRVGGVDPADDVAGIEDWAQVSKAEGSTSTNGEWWNNMTNT